MPIRETGKRRAQRIPLDYYKRPDAILRGKRVLSVIALVLSLGWWASGLEFKSGAVESSARGRLRYSKGPVARVHETWDSKCDVCHKPFEAMDSKRWSPPFLSTGNETDHLCQSCHQGPTHHQTQRPEDVKSCAGCHIDHRGRDASLVILADNECTSCHANLTDHRIASSKPIDPKVNSIRAFATDHPPFSTEGPKASDPGKLLFNHALHLNPGQTSVAGSRAVKTLASIENPEVRERYRRKGQADSAPIQLDCASCHVADPGDFDPKETALGARTSGALMTPISFERHCVACHALTFDPTLPGRSVPHGEQPQTIRQYLEDVYAGQLLKADAKLQSKPVPKAGFPGRRPEPSEIALKQRLDESVARAEKVLYEGKQTCGECHVSKPATVAGLPASIVPPEVPDLWLAKANFDHSAHRAVSCADCHGKARESTRSADVLIPGIESCRECHAPSSTRTSPKGEIVSVGGVRHDCTECHRYHNGDHPRQGRGALAEAAASPRSVYEFLTGKPGGAPVDQPR